MKRILLLIPIFIILMACNNNNFTLCDCCSTVRTSTGTPPSSMTIPNVITANGDGFNDNFHIMKPDTIAINVKIKDHNGNVVYQATNYQNDFDGSQGSGSIPENQYDVEITGPGFTVSSKLCIVRNQYNNLGCTPTCIPIDAGDPMLMVN